MDTASGLSAVIVNWNSGSCLAHLLESMEPLGKKWARVVVGRQRVAGRKLPPGPGKGRGRTRGGRRKSGLRWRGQPGNRTGRNALGPASESGHHPSCRAGGNPLSRGR